jgi:hypothetical protein
VTGRCAGDLDNDVVVAYNSSLVVHDSDGNLDVPSFSVYSIPGSAAAEVLFIMDVDGGGAALPCCCAVFPPCGTCGLSVESMWTPIPGRWCTCPALPSLPVMVHAVEASPHKALDSMALADQDNDILAANPGLTWYENRRCPVGQYSVNGALPCTACPAGAVCPQGATSPMYCAAGKFSQASGCVDWCVLVLCGACGPELARQFQPLSGRNCFLCCPPPPHTHTHAIPVQSPWVVRH